jgi:hypothetical protein
LEIIIGHQDWHAQNGHRADRGIARKHALPPDTTHTGVAAQSPRSHLAQNVQACHSARRGDSGEWSGVSGIRAHHVGSNNAKYR